MAYQTQQWTAPQGTGLYRYAKGAETETHITLTLDPESITNTPTPITVARLNHMERGIEEAHDIEKVYPIEWREHALGQTNRFWSGMTTLGTNVYASATNGDIYKQTGGTGDFVALGQNTRQWRGMTTLGNDVYACVNGGDIYKLSFSNTIRASADFTLSAYPDGSRKRIANTHASNTITCTLPSGQTMNGAGTISIPAGIIIDIELIGTTWKDNLTGNIEIYSTTEKRIGTWIDGKPLYRKVVNLGALPNATTKAIAHGISNIGFIKLYGDAYSSTGNFFSLPFIPITEFNQAVNFYVSTGEVVITSYLDRSNYTGIAVLEYTKTTD